MSVPPPSPGTFAILDDSPFTIIQLHDSNDSQASLWLIREHDDYGEYPHIYIKICRQSDGSGVLVLSDTGCATATTRKSHNAQQAQWDLRTFLEYTLNPEEKLPYLVITTHCHYDHILGLKKLLPGSNSPAPLPSTISSPAAIIADSDVQVLAPTTAKSFIQPFSHLQRHSLCSDMNINAPHYDVSIWAADQEPVIYQSFGGGSDSKSAARIPTNITILHTPGHSPDSLSWYDHDAHLLCVGDSFYRKESRVTRSAPWGAEKPAPTIFSRYGDLVVWWGMMWRLLVFVRERNRELVGQKVDRWEAAKQRRVASSDGNTPSKEEQDGTMDSVEVTSPRVALAAGHVDCDHDAEKGILAMQEFMAAILRDTVPSVQMDDEHWLWDYALDDNGEISSEYSVLAPLSVVEKARRELPSTDFTA